jgi:segregation and condensation protein A
MNSVYTNSELNFKLENLSFEGPLDLLLTLIYKNKVDIYDIPITLILDQYLEYIEAMKGMNMDVAGEFITMAAQLMVIKSKMLLPQTKKDGEEDPRTDFAASLIAYENVKKASISLGNLYMEYSGRSVKETDEIDVDNSYVAPHDLDAIVKAFERIVKRQRIMAESRNDEAEANLNTIVVNKITPIDVKVVSILRELKAEKNMSFEVIVEKSRSRSDIVATFLATLQLIAKNIIFIKEFDENNIPILEINYDRERRKNPEFTDSGLS